MEFDIPQFKATGSGRIIDRKTGKVTHFTIGDPPPTEPSPTPQQPQQGESNDLVDSGA